MTGMIFMLVIIFVFIAILSKYDMNVYDYFEEEEFESKVEKEKNPSERQALAIMGEEDGA